MGDHGSEGIKIFTGTSNPGMAEAVARFLETPLGKCRVSRFSDGEIQVEIGENIRGQDTYIIQSTCSDANVNLMELLIMVDALKRASARRITAVIPYMGYSRQDRRTRAAAVAKLDAITTKIGAPEQWHDYGSMRITRDDLVGNVREYERWMQRVAAVVQPRPGPRRRDTRIGALRCAGLLPP